MQKKILLLFITICAISTGLSGCSQNKTPTANDYDYQTAITTVGTLGTQNDYLGVIQVVTTYLQNHELTQDTFSILLYRAASYSYLNQIALAIQDYETAVPFINNLDNVQQREYSMVFFSLGFLYTDQDNAEKAISYYTRGLQLEPSSNYYQIQLGQIYEDLGRNEDALQQYIKLRDTFPLVKEEQVIVQMKIDHLSNQIPPFNFTIPASYYPYFTIKIIPINTFTAPVNLHDMGVVLQSKYRVAFEVLSPISIPEEEMLDEQKNQYDAEKIITYLENHVNDSVKHNAFLIAITDYDIFSGTANFVFSLQNFDVDIAVISTYRFEYTLPIMQEAEILLGHRMGIQFICTVGRLFGSSRPTDPTCPLAYSESILEFERKSSKLCAETQDDVDTRMQQWSESLVPFTDTEKADIQNVYTTYYFE